MILYFTGTGNSAYVAKAIADRLNDDVVSSNELIKSGIKGSFKSDNPWVFVFPVYLSTIAKVFADFIRESAFEGNKKAYFVATCASVMGATPNHCAEICKKKNLSYMGTELVQMPQNYIALFKMTEPDECERRINASLETVDDICNKIKSEEMLGGKKVSAFESVSTKWVEKIYNGPFTKTKKFYATDECISCGLCERRCVLNNIEMKDGKPSWKGSCIHCMACINSCPKKAIEYGKNTIGKDRYYCKEYSK